MRGSSVLLPAAVLAALALADAARLPAQGAAGPSGPDFSAEAPAAARSGPTWLIRSPDLRSPRVGIALGVPRDGAVVVFVASDAGDASGAISILEEVYDGSAVRAWADSAVAILRATEQRPPAEGVARTPRAVGERGISLQLEVIGAGTARRFGLLVMDSLGEEVMMPELDAAAAAALSTRLIALARFAAGERDPVRVLGALGLPFFEFQVEKPAIARANNPPPIYPDRLRAEGIEGEVLVQFVVDTAGRADMRTFKVLKATHPEFIFAVRSVLPRYRFQPAETDGQKVNMYVQMPFRFSIDHATFVAPVPGGTARPHEGWP